MDSSNSSDTPTLTRHLLATLMNRTDIEGPELINLLVTLQVIILRNITYIHTYSRRQNFITRSHFIKQNSDFQEGISQA